MAAEGPGSTTYPDDLQIGEWMLEPSIDRLSRNGTVVHLRPQLTNLLVLLAQNAGRTVSKDQILSVVWEGQFVAESGMTRCIAEIRQAFGDDARDPKIVQTVTKRGYRLMAPVARVERSESDAPVLGAADSMVAIAAPSFEGQGQAVVPATIDQAGCRAAEANPALATVGPARVSRWRSRPRAWRVGSAALVACAGFAMIAATWGVVSRGAAPVLTARDTVLLADVVNTTADPSFDETLRLALAVQLGQAPYLRILPDTQVRASLGLMGKPVEEKMVGAVALELCRREGAALLLAGSISKVGSHYAVGLEAVGCANGDLIDTQLVEVRSKDDVLGALGRAAGRLRQRLGESRESLGKYDVPITHATTSSLDALQALSLGDVARDRARLSEALLHYRRATQLDPLFALAWARRGATAHNLARAAGDERSGEFDEARSSFVKAYELRARVSEPERFYILAHYNRSVLGDPEKALETYTLWSRMYPGSMVPVVNSASILANLYGRYDAALSDARQGVVLAPTSSVANLSLVSAYLGSGRLPEARQAIRDATLRGVDDLEWRRMGFEMAFFDRDAATMAEHRRWASSDATATVAITGLRALGAASTGRLREARDLWDEADRAATQVGTPGPRVSVLLARAEAEALLGDPRLARAAAGAAVAADRRQSTRLAAASVFALSGDAARAGQMMKTLSSPSEPDTFTSYVWDPVARALVASAAGRHVEATEFARRYARFEQGRYFRLVPLGARGATVLRAGRSDEAVAAFSLLLSIEQLAPVSPWVPFARLGLARALREAGKVDASRAAYKSLIDSMSEGDHDAPLLVAARREAAAFE